LIKSIRNFSQDFYALYKICSLFLAAAGFIFADSLIVSPTSGTITAGQAQSFTLTYTGQLGGLMLALVGPSGSGNSCYVAYAASTNSAYVADDLGTTWASQGVLGSATPIKNNQCSLNLTNSKSTSAGSSSTLNLPLSLSSSFSGDRFLYTRSWDAANNATPWQQAGTVTVVLPSATPVPAPTPVSGSSLDAEENSFLGILNNYRSQNGLGPLQISAQLEASSRWMSNDMATKNYFSHTDSLGRNPFTRMIAFGYLVNQTSAGENLAAGYSDAQNSFHQWLNACDADANGACTYGHRMNMLNASYQKIGIARTYNVTSTYRWYWTTDFGGL